MSQQPIPHSGPAAADPADCCFDAWAIPTPAGSWEYLLDDFGIVYGPGWWPFHNYPAGPYAERAKSRPCGIRVAPGRAFRAWRNEYVELDPHRPDSAVVRCRLYLYVRPQGHGAIVLERTATLDLRAARYHLDHRGYPPELTEQFETKVERLLQFVLAHRRLRRTGAARPVFAHELWTQGRLPESDEVTR